MSHIYRGSASIEEVKNFTGGKDIVVAYAKNQDNPREIGYDYWYDIKHPDTGETLKAVKGYCNPNNTNQCYYAEYRDEQGRSWHYLDARSYPDPELRGDKSIQQQISEDASEYKKKKFFAESDTDKNSKGSTETHRKFFDEDSKNESQNNNEDQTTAQPSKQNNPNNNYNGQ